MTREEAINTLSNFKRYISGGGAIDKKANEAIDIAIEALDERKVELFDDGTLVVNVKEGEKVGRVLICGDDHFGGLYYIDAEPVKHGHWEITEAYPHIVYCSECHKRYAQGNWPVWNDKDTPLPRNYCPNCGAKMDGDMK